MIKRNIALLALLGPTVSLTVHAETYMTVAQAVAAIFPGKKMTKASIQLTDDEVNRIKKLSNEDVRSKTLNVWHDASGDIVYIDQVVGKHEFIPIAVGIANGQIKGLEVLAYHETYGSDVHKPNWVGQFTGKTVKNPIKLGDDIQNISGATLSSLHLTNGVRRLAFTDKIIHERNGGPFVESK